MEKEIFDFLKSLAEGSGFINEHYHRAEAGELLRKHGQSRQAAVSGSLPTDGKPPYNCPNRIRNCENYPSCGCEFIL